MKQQPDLDVIIIGGGPAGLSCALLLGRCRRKVLVFDEGLPRNRRSGKMNGFISRDGFPPLKFLEIARDELSKYDVTVIRKRILRAEKKQEYFQVFSGDGKVYHCKKLVVATGIIDKLPEVKCIDRFYGSSAFHCPYCDGWENAGKRIVVMGDVRSGAALAMNLKTWSDNVSILADGKDDIPGRMKQKLRSLNINVHYKRVKELAGSGGLLEKVVFEDGSELPAETLFFSYGFDQHCEIAKEIGCEFSKKGLVRTNKLQETNVPGFYVVGDASRDMQLVIVAASEGTKAGVAIHTALMTGK